MTGKRPVNLDLRTIKLPITAIGSILHRASGFILFFFIPVCLWMLHASLRSAQSYQDLSSYLDSFIFKFIIWAFLAGLIYHLVAGIKHLFADVGVGESLAGSRAATILTFAISIVLIALLGVWIW
jgi:succinate dehydrogenase / fumarate reductase cytochrome b subunit